MEIRLSILFIKKLCFFLSTIYNTYNQFANAHRQANQKMGFSPYILLQKYIILLLGQYRQKLYPPPLQNFLGKALVVWIGHQQKTIPALRSEEQVPALGVPPGVGRCRQHTPPTIYLFLFHTELRAVRTLTVCRGYCSLLGNLSPVGRKLSYLCALLVCRGFWTGVGAGVGQGFVWFAYLPTILVCWLSDAFGTRFLFFWQTKGHTLIQC